MGLQPEPSFPENKAESYMPGRTESKKEVVNLSGT